MKLACTCMVGLLLAFGCTDTHPKAPTPTATTTATTSRAPNPTLEALRRAIDDHYSHRDRLGLDWNQLFADAASDLATGSSRDDLVHTLVKLLAHARDPHLALVVDGKLVVTDPTKVEWNFA